MIADRDNHAPAASIGDNKPPLKEQVALEIDDRLAALAARKAGILASLARLVVNDNETTGRAGDFVAICQTFLDHVEAERRAAKQPLDEAVATIQARVANFVQEVVDAAAEAEQRVNTFRTAQRQRAAAALQKQREEEARLRAEATARNKQSEQDRESADKGELSVQPPVKVVTPVVAPVRPAEVTLPVARGDYGAKVRDKVEKTFRITDVRNLPDTILDAPKVRAAMLAAIKQLARLQETIPGVEIGDAVTDSIRKGA